MSRNISFGVGISEEPFGSGQYKSDVSTKFNNCYWEPLDEALNVILNPASGVKVSFGEIFTLVYKCVCDGFCNELHYSLRNKIHRHVQSFNDTLTNIGHHCDKSKVVSLIRAINVSLDAFLSSIQQISKLFTYMDKTYIEVNNEDSAHCIHNVACFIYCDIILESRISNLVSHIETSPAFTFSPADLSSFFVKVNQISQGRYAKIFPNMFARYIPNILPPMCESDIPAHINDVAMLQQHLRASGYNNYHPTGIKRRVDD